MEKWGSIITNVCLIVIAIVAVIAAISIAYTLMPSVPAIYSADNKGQYEIATKHFELWLTILGVIAGFIVFIINFYKSWEQRQHALILQFEDKFFRLLAKKHNDSHTRR